LYTPTTYAFQKDANMDNIAWGTHFNQVCSNHMTQPRSYF